MVNGRLDKGEYTRLGTTGNSLVDYAICDDEMARQISFFSVVKQLPESDHCPIIVKFSGVSVTTDKECNSVTSQKYLCKPENIYNFQENFNSAQCKHLLQDFYVSMSDNCDVNVVTSMWEKVIDFSMNASFPLVDCRPPRPVKMWFDEECKNRRQEILECVDDGYRGDLIKTYKTLKQQKKRQYRKCILDTIDQACGSDSKIFWNTINKLPHNVADRNKTCKLDPQTICDQLKELSQMPDQQYFNREFEDECKKFLDLYDKDECELDIDANELEILNNNISCEEIKCAISCLKKGKAPGLDLIPAEIVKLSSEALIPHLEILYNFILAKEVYPSKWAEGLRIAIPKGDNDIRPITIEPIFGKIFEIILEKRLWFLNNAFDRGDKYNGGFVKGR